MSPCTSTTLIVSLLLLNSFPFHHYRFSSYSRYIPLHLETSTHLRLNYIKTKLAVIFTLLSMPAFKKTMPHTSHRMHRSATTALAVLALIVTPSAAHSWIQHMMVINPKDNSLVGTPGYARNNTLQTAPGFTDLDMVHILPSDGAPALEQRALNRRQAASPTANSSVPPMNPITSVDTMNIKSTDPMCKKTQQAPFQSADSPMLAAAPGDLVALLYQENGHVTLPQNQPGKQPNRGNLYVYGTTQPKSPENFLDVFQQWTADGTGGDKRGKLLANGSYDDGRCYQVNNGEISIRRQKDFPKASDPLMGANLWCQIDVPIPTDAPNGRPYTLYWVWTWPTEPGVDPGLPKGKAEIYTTCMDVDVKGSKASRSLEARADPGPADIGNMAIPAQVKELISPSPAAQPAAAPQAAPPASSPGAQVAPPASSPTAQVAPPASSPAAQVAPPASPPAAQAPPPASSAPAASAAPVAPNPPAVTVTVTVSAPAAGSTNAAIGPVSTNIVHVPTSTVTTAQTSTMQTVYSASMSVQAGAPAPSKAAAAPAPAASAPVGSAAPIMPPSSIVLQPPVISGAPPASPAAASPVAASPAAASPAAASPAAASPAAAQAPASALPSPKIGTYTGTATPAAATMASTSKNGTAPAAGKRECANKACKKMAKRSRILPSK